MSLQPVRTEAAPAPLAGAPYSQAIVARGDRMVFVSGQVPIDPATGAVVPGGVDRQTRRCLDNVAAILRAAGADLSDVAMTTVYLTDMADFAEMNAVYADVFAGHAPARATVGVAALPGGARVEVEAVAVL